MERESCDYDIAMSKALRREDKALKTVYFEKMEWTSPKIKTFICGSQKSER